MHHVYHSRTRATLMMKNPFPPPPFLSFSVFPSEMPSALYAFESSDSLMTFRSPRPRSQTCRCQRNNDKRRRNVRQQLSLNILCQTFSMSANVLNPLRLLQVIRTVREPKLPLLPGFAPGCASGFFALFPFTRSGRILQ